MANPKSAALSQVVKTAGAGAAASPRTRRRNSLLTRRDKIQLALTAGAGIGDRTGTDVIGLKNHRFLTTGMPPKQLVAGLMLGSTKG